MENRYLNNLIDALHLEMTKKQLKLVTAESCTGGLIAAKITEKPGSSHWFDRGFVTYSNRSKQEMLDVPESMIDEQGAVSEQVARAMADGALRYSQADLSLSVTGIAGPEGGSTDKPVGTVHFAWSSSWTQTIHTCQQFSGNRQEIRDQSCVFALSEIIRIIHSLKNI